MSKRKSLKDLEDLIHLISKLCHGDLLISRRERWCFERYFLRKFVCSLSGGLPRALEKVGVEILDFENYSHDYCELEKP
ncbi:hypothetical protein Tco_1539644 [Tanacetum coccineum]